MGHEQYDYASIVCERHGRKICQSTQENLTKLQRPKDEVDRRDTSAISGKAYTREILKGSGVDRDEQWYVFSSAGHLFGPKPG